MYWINIFDGKEGTFLYNVSKKDIGYLEDTILEELDNSNGVELYSGDFEESCPVDNYEGHGFKTDSDGFCSLAE